MINITQGISHPRSGTNILNQLIILYFKDQCKITKESPHKISSKNNPFTRNMDVNLSFPKDERNYIIQYRNPIRSLVSLSRDHHTTIEKQFKGSVYNLTYWSKFMKKWVLSPPKNCIILHYQDFISDYKNNFKKVINFMTNGEYSEEVYRKNIGILEESGEIKIEDRRRFEKIYLGDKNITANFNRDELEEFLDREEEKVKDILEASNILSWREAI